MQISFGSDCHLKETAATIISVSVNAVAVSVELEARTFYTATPAVVSLICVTAVGTVIE